MADVSVFDWVCAELEAHSSLNKLESRGTVRIVLRVAGLEARTVTPGEMQVAVSKVLPDELRARGVEDNTTLCEGLAERLAHETFDSVSVESAHAVFERLGNAI